MKLSRSSRAREQNFRFDVLATCSAKIEINEPALVRLNGTNLGVDDFGGFQLFYTDEPKVTTPSGRFFPGGFGYFDHAGTWFVGGNQFLNKTDARPVNGDSLFNLTILEGVSLAEYSALITCNRPSCLGTVAHTLAGSTVEALPTDLFAASYSKIGGALFPAGLYAHIIGCKVTALTDPSVNPIFVWQGDGTLGGGAAGQVLSTRYQTISFEPGSFSPTHPVYAFSIGGGDLSITWYMQ